MLSTALVAAARGVLASAQERAPNRRVCARQAWTRIVGGAQACLEAHAARAIYSDDLCAWLGVSATSLAEAFRNGLGTTPHRSPKLLRRALVRAALRLSDGPAPLVRSVALSHGFWHLGQFALDYRAMYGESASATLARTRGWPIPAPQRRLRRRTPGSGARRAEQPGHSARGFPILSGA